MIHHTGRCVFALICSAVVLIFCADQAAAYQYYQISRPKLGFELGYEFDKDKRTGFRDRDDTTSTYSERVDISTDGWFYHPALLEYELTLSPEWEQIIEDNDGEKDKTRTFLQGYDAEFIFLQYKPYTITLFGNRNQSTISSNFAEKTKVDSDSYGARLNLKYSMLPTQLGYTHYENRQTGYFDFSTIKDEVRLYMRHDKHFGDTRLNAIYYNVDDTSSLTAINTNSKEASLQNTYKLYGGRKMQFTSFIEYRDKESDFYRERGMDMYEDVVWTHRKNLSTFYNVRYESFDLRDSRRREHQNYDFRLNHLLYENLTTIVHANVLKNHEYQGKETVYTAGLDWNYFRKFRGGSINATVSHTYRIYDEDPNAEAITFEQTDEQVKLTGFQETLLANKNIERSSIRVKEKSSEDVSVGKIYVLDVDYEIVELGDYLAIVRKGVSITDGSTVYVDYTYVPEEPFDYTVLDRSYGATIRLWNSLKVYYLFFRSTQEFLRGIEPETLRTYTSTTAGTEYQWRWSTTAFEYIDISSTEIPTESWKATETLIFRPAGRMFLNVVGSVGERRYKDLSESNTDRFWEGRGGLQARFSRTSSLNMESFIKESSGIVNHTREVGFSSLYEWSYNIYDVVVSYLYNREENVTTEETFIHHLFMVTLKRELF